MECAASYIGVCPRGVGTLMGPLQTRSLRALSRAAGGLRLLSSVSGSGLVAGAGRWLAHRSVIAQGPFSTPGAQKLPCLCSAQTIASKQIPRSRAVRQVSRWRSSVEAWKLGSLGGTELGMNGVGAALDGSPVEGHDVQELGGGRRR